MRLRIIIKYPFNLINIISMIDKALLTFTIFFFLSCAAIQSPSGGDKDIVPPFIVSTVPENGQINFSDQKVTLIFSEYLNSNSIKNSIKITPKIIPEPTLIFKGKKVIMNFNGPLEKDQTYIISINKNLEDEHNVRLKESKQVAFSTGSYIDDGSIAGKVYYSDEGSVNLWRLTADKNIDNFFTTVPDYTYDISNSGVYEFKYLSQGDYIVSLVNNAFAGRVLDPKNTQYSLSWYPKINIGKEISHKNVNIYMGVKNKTIKIDEINWLNGGWGNIKFSNNIYNMIPLRFYNESDKSLKNDIFIDPVDKKILHFFIHDISDTFTLIRCDGFYDSYGYYIDSLKVKIKAEAFTDTSNIQIISPKENYILPIDNESQIKLQVIFSSLVDTIKSANFLTLYEDSVEIPYKVYWESPLSMNIFLQKNWKEKTNYKLKFNQKSILPKYSRSLIDSIKIINFKTSSYQKYGILNFFPINTSDEKFIAELQPLENNLKTHNIYIDSDEHLKINKIIEGEYSLMIYNDKDENNRYSNGEIFPFKPSEWFYLYPDTIKIRSNWELDLGKIDLRIN